jgi:hypothetical protein
MKKIPARLIFFAAFGIILRADIVVITPSSSDQVKSCLDYAEQVLADRWDMNERTDLGWRIFNTFEEPVSYLRDISFSKGIFSASSVYTSGGDPDYSDAKVFILESAYPGSAMLGKVGKNYPIDAGKYTHLVMRMSLGPDAAGPYGQLLWSTDTIYNGVTTSGSFFVHNGWAFYIIDIPSLGIAAGSDPWSGLIDSLRMDPVIKKDQSIKIDWIRLVEYNSSQERTIQWSGNTGSVDIYLDNNNSPGDGNLGLLAEDFSGSSYTFLAGGLAPGTYYVAVAPTGTRSFSYSSGYYCVSSTPVLRLTKPSEEGSDKDFATVCFSDPWDMNNPEDVEHTVNVKNDQFTSINYEDLAGKSFLSQSVYYGQSVSSSLVGDPSVFFLHFLHRGGSCPIDTSRYHNLVFKMGIEGEKSVNNGSIARVMWRRNDETLENVSQDIVIRHLADRWVMNKIAFDLKHIPLEEGSGSPSLSGWTGEVDSFRIDPHEFSSSRAFFFDEVRITSDWTADSSFEIEWELNNLDGFASVSLYYDTDQAGFDGTLIVSDVISSNGTDSYVWDTSEVPEGTYWIYAFVDDGLNQNRSYSTGPVIIDHNLTPEISLSKSTLYFGAEMSSAVTSTETALLENAGEGALNWQAEPSDNWISVTPASGTGEGILEIDVNPDSLSPGTYSGRITVTDVKAWNSPQMIEVHLTVYALGGDSEPFGVFETPVDDSNVYGNIPVTGWALDDVEVTKVEIKRAPHVEDSSVIIGPDGLVYIGDAVFVRGARPDVEAAYPAYPRTDRAGWGYMLLTNFLPNGGNGTFTLYAIAYDGSGHREYLGQKVIHSDNANAVKPFGTIDTPAQGGETGGADYVNFGWALTPQPKYIPYDGSTIWVWVDGVPLGHPVYDNYREDIATLFPDYANSDGAVGYYYLDTTSFENGVHNIAWSVEDSDGVTSGIGSRYFHVFNADSGGTQSKTQDEKLLRSGVFSVTDLSEVFPSISPVYVKKGCGRQAHPGEMYPDEDGVVEIEIREVERLALSLNSDPSSLSFESLRLNSNRQSLDSVEHSTEVSECFYSGYLKFQDELRPLPIGSTLDRSTGVFTWQPGPGFLGEYEFVFIRESSTGSQEKIRVRVLIHPRF